MYIIYKSKEEKMLIMKAKAVMMQKNNSKTISDGQVVITVLKNYIGEKNGI